MTTEEFKANIMPHYMSMYRVAATVMISRDEAADAVQDAIIRLWDKRDKLNNISDLKSYCFSLVQGGVARFLRFCWQSHKPSARQPEICVKA